MDVSKLLDDLDVALGKVDEARAVVDTKQGALTKIRASVQAQIDNASAELAVASADHAKTVDAANAIRTQVNVGLAEKLGADSTGRVRS